MLLTDAPMDRRSLAGCPIPRHLTVFFICSALCASLSFIRLGTMATLIIAEKASQARDLRAALGAWFGQILAAEGHLLRLAEPEEVNPAWKSWSCVVLKPDGLFPTCLSREGNKPAKLKVIAAALRCCDDVILATDCGR